MKAIDRIYQYIDLKNIKVVDFEKKNFISNGYLSKMKQRSAGIGEDILNQILENCPDISPEWLLTGNGKMLKSDEKVGGSPMVVPHDSEKDNGGITPQNTPNLTTDIKDVIDLATQLGMQIRENEHLHRENMLLRAELDSLKPKQGRKKKEKKEKKVQQMPAKEYENNDSGSSNLAAEQKVDY